MAMAMAALPSTSALLRHRHRHRPRDAPHAPHCTTNALSFTTSGGTITITSLICNSHRQSSRGPRIQRVRAASESGDYGATNHHVEDHASTTLGLASCLEVAEDDNGSKYLHVMASSLHNVDHGCIIGLTCVPITKGHSSVRNLEFPLFLNALAASPIRIAVEKGGLPHALEELGNLNDLDLERIYVSSFSNVRGGGDFLVLDERTGSRTMVASTFPQAIAVALRYRQPFFLKLETLLSANGDFIDRMLINPLARDQDGDVEWLAELSKSMHVIVGNQSRLQTALKYAVDSEQYEEALRLKQELISYDTRMNQEAVNVLQRLRTLYLERMGIFYKL